MSNQYTIQQVAEITQVSAHTLRYYERIGLLDVDRAENGHRRYDDDDLHWIGFILLLRRTDMSLEDIAAFMRLEKEGDETLDDRRMMLACHRQNLVQYIAQLQANLSALDGKIDHYRGSEGALPDCDEGHMTGNPSSANGIGD